MKKKVIISAKIIISLTIIFFIIKNLDVNKFSEVFVQIDPKIIIPATIMLFFNFLFTTFRWQKLLFSQDIITSFAHLAKINLIGYFFNSFLLGTNGGDVVKILYIRKNSSAKKNSAMTTVFLDRLIGFISFLFMATVMCVFGIDHTAKKNLLIFFVVCYFSIFSFFFLFQKQLMKKLLPSFILNKLLKIKGVLNEIYDSVHLFRSRKMDLLIIFSLSVIAQFFLICFLYFIGVSIGIKINFYNYLTFIPIIQTISAIPISLSGFGLMEGSYVYFFNLLGASVEQAFMLSLISRGFTYILGIIGLPLYLFSNIKKNN